MTATLKDKVLAALAPGGPIASVVQGFEARAGQLTLASEWADAIEGGNVLLAEAATGIGKTLAYLVPAVLSGKQVIVSTGTKTLQTQIAEKDLPLLARTLGKDFSFVVVKGRSNYLCRSRWEDFEEEPVFTFARDASYFDRMRNFAAGTQTGDISECTGMPDDFRAWAEVNARGEGCNGNSCKHRGVCHLNRVREMASRCDIVVVNHHLFFADLSVSSRTGSEAGILPKTDVVVFDEAHGLESVATSFFSVSMSSSQMDQASRDVRAAFDGNSPLRAALPAADAFRDTVDTLVKTLSKREGRFGIGDGDPAIPLLDNVLSSGKKVAGVLAAAPSKTAVACEAQNLLHSILEHIFVVRNSKASGSVAWYERQDKTTTLYSSPVEVSGILRELLWSGSPAILLASATLSVSGNLAFFRNRLGIENARELILGSEYDFDSRALMFVPKGMPEPTDDEFPAFAAKKTRDVLGLSGGGGLVLCTSYRVMHQVKDSVRKDAPYKVHVQGEAPKNHLLRVFREDRDAVLIGTGTFWEGVDVPGDSLRCVVIDKLPFSPPNDPLTAARTKAIRDRGGDPFAEYHIPEAILTMKQGVGRLLRRADDYGVVAILDHRILTKPYGKTFIENLPGMKKTRDQNDVETFFSGFPRTEPFHSGFGP